MIQKLKLQVQGLSCVRSIVVSAVLRLRGLIYHMRSFFSTKAQKKYYHMRVLIVRFLITFICHLDRLDILESHLYQNIEKITNFNNGASVRQALNCS